MTEQRRLTRSDSDRMLVGVCGGLGEFLGVDATLVRLAFVVLSLFGGSGLALYLVMWVIVPRSSRVDADDRDVVGDVIDEGREVARDGTEAAKRAYQRLRGTETDTRDDEDDGNVP